MLHNFSNTPVTLHSSPGSVYRRTLLANPHAKLCSIEACLGCSFPPAPGATSSPTRFCRASGARAVAKLTTSSLGAHGEEGQKGIIVVDFASHGHRFGERGARDFSFFFRIFFFLFFVLWVLFVLALHASRRPFARLGPEQGVCVATGL